jgi:hypothetical protein
VECSTKEFEYLPAHKITFMGEGFGNAGLFVLYVIVYHYFFLFCLRDAEQVIG